MEKLINQVLDFPTWVNGKLPWNSWNSCMDDSQGNLAKWTGDFFRVGAFVMVVTSLVASIQGLMGMEGDAMAMVGMVLSTLLWVYAIFPIAQVVRSAGDGLSESKSDTVGLVFHDIPMAIIKVFGTVTAMIALFGAVAMTFSWITTVDVSTAYDAGMMEWMD